MQYHDVSEREKCYLHIEDTMLLLRDKLAFNSVVRVIQPKVLYFCIRVSLHEIYPSVIA